MDVQTVCEKKLKLRLKQRTQLRRTLTKVNDKNKQNRIVHYVDNIQFRQLVLERKCVCASWVIWTGKKDCKWDKTVNNQPTWRRVVRIGANNLKWYKVKHLGHCINKWYKVKCFKYCIEVRGLFFAQNKWFTQRTTSLPLVKRPQVRVLKQKSRDAKSTQQSTSWKEGVK